MPTAPDFSIAFHGLQLRGSRFGSAYTKTMQVEATSAIDPNEERFALDLFKPGDRILVAGGGLGWISARLAFHFGVANVLTCEPNPVLARFIRHIRIDDECLNVLQVAVSDHSHPAETFVADDVWPRSRLGDISAVESISGHLAYVAVAAVNELIAEHGITALLLDVEGEENVILPSLSLDKLRAIVCEFHPDPRLAGSGDWQTRETGEAALNRAGFEVFHGAIYNGYFILGAARQEALS